MSEPSSETHSFIVLDSEAGQRLDRVLAARIEGQSRAALQRLIRDGHVRRGDAVATSASAAVQEGEEIAVTLPPPVPAEPAPERMPLAIVYEDADLIVIDKPAGLVVHPAPGHAGGTLVNALLAHAGDSLSGIGGVKRPGIVHRLDKDTSGLLVVAKNDKAHRALSAQFADHGRTGALHRAYVAIAWGSPDRPHFTVDAAIARATHNREKMTLTQSGRFALTHVTVEERFGPPEKPEASLVRCELETGRTHQIRVHLASVGHPLLGDSLYGAGFATKSARLPEAAQKALAALGRQALHAGELAFEHPADGRVLEFSSPPPADLQALLDALRAG